MNLLDLSFKAESRICLSTDFSNLSEQIHLFILIVEPLWLQTSVALFTNPICEVLSFQVWNGFICRKVKKVNQQGYLELSKSDSQSPEIPSLLPWGGVTGDMADLWRLQC